MDGGDKPDAPPSGRCPPSFPGSGRAAPDWTANDHGPASLSNNLTFRASCGPSVRHAWQEATLPKQTGSPEDIWSGSWERLLFPMDEQKRCHTWGQARRPVRRARFRRAGGRSPAMAAEDGLDRRATLFYPDIPPFAGFVFFRRRGIHTSLRHDNHAGPRETGHARERYYGKHPHLHPGLPET